MPLPTELVPQSWPRLRRVFETGESAGAQFLLMKSQSPSSSIIRAGDGLFESLSQVAGVIFFAWRRVLLS